MNKEEFLNNNSLKQFILRDELNAFLKEVQKHGTEAILEGEMHTHLEMTNTGCLMKRRLLNRSKVNQKLKYKGTGNRH